MEPFFLQEPTFFTIKTWMDQYKGLVAGMTTKNGGVSNGPYTSLNFGFHVGDDPENVLMNRKRLSRKLDFSLHDWVGAEQIHDVVIRKVTNSDKGKGSDSYEESFKGTDGFYTNEQGILLTLCYADCVPLFFIAPEQRMIGTAHAGWKGTVKQIAVHMVEQWKQDGIDPQQIYVTIGPCICKKCYIVDKRVIDLVQNILEDVEQKTYNLIKEGQYELDLREVNRQLLFKAGVPEENIFVTNYCSSCDESEFFSHRRDHGKTGRMLSFIGWKEESCHL